MAEASPFKHAEADDSAGFLLWKITALWQARLAQVLGEFGITQTQYAILASLRWFQQQGTATTQSHLVTHTKIDKMTLSKAIRKLEAAGLVQRQTSASDSRATAVKFSPKGRQVIDKAIQAVEAADDAFFACLPPAQLETYKALTRAVIGAQTGSECT